MSGIEDKIAEVKGEIDGHPGLGKKMAKYGAIGAVVAIPLPFIGPIIGAVAGSAYAYSQRNKI